MLNLLQHFRESSAYSGANASFIEDLYELYLEDPDSIPTNWSKQFQDLVVQGDDRIDIPHSPIRKQFVNRSASSPTAHIRTAQPDSEILLQKQSSVARLIHQYRVSGHLQANWDPLDLNPRPPAPDLDPTYYDLGEHDKAREYLNGCLDHYQHADPTFKPLVEARETLSKWDAAGN